jgi:hypothetical protein
MAAMTIDELAAAAELAESLSTFRHKKIRLVLTPTGIRIEGRLLRPDGVLMDEAEAEMAWDASGAAELATLIRQVDRKLVFEWTHMEPVDDH